jgi:hypothetical protein
MGEMMREYTNGYGNKKRTAGSTPAALSVLLR